MTADETTALLRDPESPPPSDSPAPPALSPRDRARIFQALPALAIGIFLSAADQTIVVASYSRIGSDFNALDRTSWIATAYLVTMTSFQPLYGKLSDIFGRQATLLFSFGVFAAGCAMCGLARSLEELIAARAFAGIGGGGLTAVTAIVLSDVVPLRQRGKWQGYNNIVYATGAGVGAPLGGWLADTVGWRWSFLVQVPLAAVAFANVALCLKIPVRAGEHWRKKLRRVDFAGAGLLVMGISAGMVGLDRGAAGGWAEPLTVGMLGVAPVVLAGFVWVELRVAKEPVAPRSVLFARSSLACLVCNFCSYGAWLALIYYLPLYWQAVEHLSATQAGLRLLPGIAAVVCGSLFAGFIMQRTATYYRLTLGCYVLATAAVPAILLFTGLWFTSLAGTWTGLTLCGFGIGIGGTSTLVALIATAEQKDQAASIGCMYLFRSLGSTIGISMSAAIIQQTLRYYLRSGLPRDLDVEEVTRRVLEDLEYVEGLPEAAREVVYAAYGKATRWAFAGDWMLVGGAMVAAAFIVERSLQR